MIININEFEARVKSGLIHKFTNGEYTGWCYTKKCQSDEAWDEYTMLARGIVTLIDGTVISRPFPKFFNLGDPRAEPIPWDEPMEITEKIDGSLIIVSFHDGKMILNSKGSFKSEHAIFARKWIEDNMTEWMDLAMHYSTFKLGNWTYCFEAIFPEVENIKTIQYGDRADLTLLAIIFQESGREFNYRELELYSRLIKGKLVQKHASNNIEDVIKKCKARSIHEGEGLVFHFLKSNKRIKVKSDEYLRLSRLISHISKKHILDVLIHEDSLESIYAALPDELYQEVKNIASELQAQYTELDTRAESIANELRSIPSKKKRALYLLSKPELSQIKIVVFEKLDNKDGKKAVWSIIRKLIKEVELKE